MSFFGDLFGTGSSSRTTTQTGSANVPEDVLKSRQQLMGMAQAFAAEPYPAYVDAQGRAIPRVAGFTPDQQTAFGTTRNIAQQSGALAALTPELAQQGIAATRGLAQTLPNVDLSGYMSPYTESVLEPALRDIQERAAQERLRLGQQSARTGSFGGSRQAIAESELERGTPRTMGDLSATQRAAAYNNALAQFRADQQRIPEMYAAMQGQLGTALGQIGGRIGREVSPLLQTGELQRAYDQAGLDVLRREFEEQRDFPLRGIEVLRGALGINPSGLGVSTTQRTTQPGPNLFGQTVGLLTQAPAIAEGAKTAWSWLTS